MMRIFQIGWMIGLGLALTAAAASPKADAPAVNKTPPTERRFDFGAAKTPLWPGFERFTKASVYSPQSGYGWMDKNPQLVERAMPLMRGHPNPDDLTGDWEIWRGGDTPLRLRVDLPDGKYQVVIWEGGSRGSYLYDLGSLTVLANGEPMVQVNRDAAWLKKEWFKGSDNRYEWKPVDDIWEKYVHGQFCHIHRFDVEVTDGKLEIGFDKKPGPAGPNGIGEYLALNAMVIYPAAKSGELDTLLKRIETERRKQFNEIARLVPPPVAPGKLPALDAKMKRAGYVPFVRPRSTPLYYNSVPTAAEIKTPFALEAAHGQRVSGRLAIYPLKDLKDVRLEITPLRDAEGHTLAAGAVQWHWLRYIEQPVFYRRRANIDYRPVPKLLMPAGSSNAVKGMPRAFSVAVTPPRDAAAGDYRGAIRIVAGDGAALEVPIRVKVWPFALTSYPDDDERIYIYRPFKSLYRNYGQDSEFSLEDTWRRIDGDLKLMKEYGIAPTILFNWKASADDLKRFMSLYMKYDFRGHPLFGDYTMLNMIDGHTRRPQKVKIDYQPYIEKMKEVIALQKANHWPTFAFYCTAEIHAGMPSYQAAREGFALMKKAVPEAVLVALTNQPPELQVLADSQADIVGPNAISMTADGVELVREAGKKLWFYGWGRNRFRTGLIDWRVGSRGGVHEWYSYISQRPFNPFDGKEADCYNDAPPYIGPEGPIPTPGMEETADGRVDFLYLATLDLSLKAAKDSKNPAAAEAIKKAEAVLASIKKRVKPDYYYYYKRQKQMGGSDNTMDVDISKITGWTANDYDQMRKQVAECIIELQKNTRMDGGTAAAGR